LYLAKHKIVSSHIRAFPPHYCTRSNAPRKNKMMQKTKEIRKYGEALDQNAPRSTSLGGHSKSVPEPIESSELPLDITQRVLNTLPQEFQDTARRLEEKGLVRIIGEV
jgi:hypothetical protein